jgi:hypothetical protein
MNSLQTTVQSRAFSSPKTNLLVFALSMSLPVVSCTDGAADRKSKSDGKAASDTTLQVKQADSQSLKTRLHRLYLSRDQFLALAGGRGNANKKLVFQFRIPKDTPDILSLAGMAPKANDEFPDGYHPLPIGDEVPDVNIGNNEVLLSTQKLRKASVDDIVRELNANPRPKFVIFHPIFGVPPGGLSQSNHVYYQVFTAANLQAKLSINLVGYYLDPSPPASFADNAQ